MAHEVVSHEAHQQLDGDLADEFVGPEASQSTRGMAGTRPCSRRYCIASTSTSS
jgi:hypothetical protein